jgi:hypothetical protein
MEKFKIALPIILVVVFTSMILLASQQLKTSKLFEVSPDFDTGSPKIEQFS